MSPQFVVLVACPGCFFIVLLLAYFQVECIQFISAQKHIEHGSFVGGGVALLGTCYSARALCLSIETKVACFNCLNLLEEDSKCLMNELSYKPQLKELHPTLNNGH